MKTLTLVLGLACLTSLLTLCGCEKPAPPSPTQSPERTPAPEEVAQSPEAGEPQEQALQEDEAVEPQDEGEMQSNRLWPDDPRAREVLIDPHDESTVASYWHNAKVGDWVLFLTWEKKLAMYTVAERDGMKLKYQARHFERDGTETSAAEPDIRSVDIQKDDEITRSSLIQNILITRTVYDRKLYNSDKVLVCERRYVPNPSGENNETLWSREVRCGGYVFQRRGSTAVVTLIDYGDAQHLPKWDSLKPAELLRYWHENDKFIFEELVVQDDDPRGEPPEMPEDPAPEEVVKKIKEIEKLLGKETTKALKEKRFKHVLSSLEGMGALVVQLCDYAGKNNLKPALTQTVKVNTCAGDLRKACDKGDARKAASSLSELRKELDWLYRSAGYKKKDKRQ